MKLFVALLAVQLVEIAVGFVPAAPRPRLLQVKLAAPRSPQPARLAVGAPSLSSSRVRALAAASAAAAPQAAGSARPFAGVLRRAAAAATARMSWVRCCVAAFVRQHRLRARACGFVAGCVFAMAAAAPLPAHAAPAGVTPGLPIQEKIARQHEAWVYKNQVAARGKAAKFAMLTPVFIVGYLQAAKAMIKYTKYQDRMVIEDDIALYGEYISPDTTALKEEPEEAPAEEAPPKDKKKKKDAKKGSPEDDLPPKSSDNDDLL